MKRRGNESADLVLFGLSADATAADLKRAYRKAALELHPDQNPDPAAAVRFRELADAYRRLEATLPPAARKRPLQERAEWFIADAQALLRRWPAERWQTPVDGLPAVVWLTSALTVLAERWPPRGPVPAGPRIDTLAEALAQWRVWLTEHPLGRPERGKPVKALNDALTAAETRLKALDRPSRSRS